MHYRSFFIFKFTSHSNIIFYLQIRKIFSDENDAYFAQKVHFETITANYSQMITVSKVTDTSFLNAEVIRQMKD